MKLGFSDFKRGTRIEIDDIPYEILEYEREKIANFTLQNEENIYFS